MTENPVGVSPNTCHKTRGCPGPMQTVPKPICSAPCPLSKGPTGIGPHGCRPPGDLEDDALCRRKCGCMRTSDKLKQILQTFPGPQPPGDIQAYMAKKCDKASGYSYGQTGKTGCTKPISDMERCESAGSAFQQATEKDKMQTDAKTSSRSWQIVSELVSLVQLSVTATALALYYLIYCYMQLVYYTLRSALYFHNADGPMKITIGVVTLTSLIVGFNILMRMEGIIGIVH